MLGGEEGWHLWDDAGEARGSTLVISADGDVVSGIATERTRSVHLGEGLAISTWRIVDDSLGGAGIHRVQPLSSDCGRLVLKALQACVAGQGPDLIELLLVRICFYSRKSLGQG